MPKDKLLLLANADNIFDFNQRTIDAQKLDPASVQNIINTMKLFVPKAKAHFAHNLITRQLDNGLHRFDFVPIKHPLPSAFNIREKKIIINTSIWRKKDVLNVDPRDIYTSLVYGFVGAYYTVKSIDSKDTEVVMDYMANIWIKIFGKKYGLIGSYTKYIPMLRFLVNVHTLVSFFNIPQGIAYKTASNLAKFNMSELEINPDDYDFYNTKDFIRTLSDSGVLFGISLHEFAATIIKFLGTVTLPMFEDGMRFMATIAGSSVNSNTIFPPSIPKYNMQLFDRLINGMEKTFK